SERLKFSAVTHAELDSDRTQRMAATTEHESPIRGKGLTTVTMPLPAMLVEVCVFVLVSPAVWADKDREFNLHVNHAAG
ncbi:unnamed protein product, partial [Lampetra fluviatilis]